MGPPRGFVTASLAMDDLIASTGVAYRALTNPSFMDNIVRQAESINNQGVFFSPIAGDRKLPAVATRDIAATASRLLVDTSWSGVGEVPLLGPEDLSLNDMAEIISDVLGKQVRFQQTTFEAYKDRFVGASMSEAMAQGMTDMAAAKNDGIDDEVPRTPGNSTPTSFSQWCEGVLRPAVTDHAATIASLRPIASGTNRKADAMPTTTTAGPHGRLEQRHDGVSRGTSTGGEAPAEVMSERRRCHPATPSARLGPGSGERRRGTGRRASRRRPCRLTSISSWARNTLASFTLPRTVRDSCRALPVAGSTPPHTRTSK